MIKADVLVNGDVFCLQMMKGGSPGQVDILWMGSRQSSHIVADGDCGQAAKAFCRSLSGIINSGQDWGVELCICGFVFPFGKTRLSGGSTRHDLTPIQRELIDLWRQYGQRGSAESAIIAVEKMISEAGSQAM